MSEQDSGMVLGELLDEEELKAFQGIAEFRGVTLEQLAKKAIQQTITDRTRPRTMTGKVQAFFRRE
ncbi:hypothetical protein LU689_29335 [Pseudomonas asiatica]|uniref:hypothetical protein n=1 Tax=Pseudomonas asiatica TaxID=2219225 RepID=UPI001E420A44|nr:hypothetical protein [Pseudomonas asiatica]MCE0854006.1 hypothetical protein [Pseudomonas asiatica]